MRIFLYFILLLVCPILIAFSWLEAEPLKTGLNTKSLQWSQAEIATLTLLSNNNTLSSYSDPSNKYLKNPDAIKLGKDLFNDKRMSSNQSVACATCHIKQKAFTDGRNIALGIRIGVRNTPSLLNVAQHNWFFWDGRKDSLWSQALAPLENPAEHAFSRLQMIHFIANDVNYRKRYEHVFKQQLPAADSLSKLPEKGSPNSNIDDLIAWKKLPKQSKKIVNRLFSNIGKAIAAYVSTLKSKPTNFDLFVKELNSQGQSGMLDLSAQRGLKLFIGRANCVNCHRGALFSNKEFHNIGSGIPGKDNGRAEVISEVKHDIFNCLGEFSDASADQCTELKFMNTDSHAMAGAFRTPSLRNVSNTAPYMHDGRFKNLRDVLNYYAGIDKKKAAQTDLPEMNLSEQDQNDIVRFLQSL